MNGAPHESMKLAAVESVLAGISVPKVPDVVFGEDTRKVRGRGSEALRIIVPSKARR